MNTNSQPKVHHFVAYAFSQAFKIGDLADQQVDRPVLVGPKAAAMRKLDGGGVVFFFNFGAITFWNVDALRVRQFIDGFLQKRLHIREIGCSEEYIVHEKDGEAIKADFSYLQLNHLSAERAEVVALTVAQSVAMEYHERLIEGVWQKVMAMVEDLRLKGNVTPRPRRLHPMIAEALSIRASVVGIMHLLDRPDLIWTDKEMDTVYADLRASFDMVDRFQAIEYKSSMIQDSIEVLLDMARDRRLFIVEVAIVLLILVEVIMSLAKL